MIPSVLNKLSDWAAKWQMNIIIPKRYLLRITQKVNLAISPAQINYSPMLIYPLSRHHSRLNTVKDKAYPLHCISVC